MKEFIKRIYACLLLSLLNFSGKADNISINNTTLLTSLNQTNSSDRVFKSHKDWNFLVYMAANNNLNQFALNNIEQMKKIGSTKNINILVQIDQLGETEVCRYFVKKNKLEILDNQFHHSGVTSGTPESLFNFIKWGVETFPANNQAVVLWNHGSGIKDPSIWGRFLSKHRNELYIFNDNNKLFELNHKIIQYKNIKNLILHEIEEALIYKGIAFNETFHTYLTNQDLKNALENVVKTVLHGKKINILCMDACHMGMIEVASQVNGCTDYVVGSEEVEPGGGYNYEYVLKPFENGTLSAKDFSQKVVDAFGQEYSSSYAEYTQSVFDLRAIPSIETHMANLAKDLTSLMNAATKPCYKLLRKIRNSITYTQEFYDTDYIDMCTFLNSLYISMDDPKFIRKLPTRLVQDVKKIQNTAISCLNSMQNLIIKTTCGPSFKNALGAAIYFPKRNVHLSYIKTVFDKNTKWSQFLNTYLAIRSKYPTYTTDKSQNLTSLES